jgi:GT2 family glycosyltransferase
LKSLENQIVKPIEIIIVDDGDFQKTKKLLKDMDFDFKKIIHLKKDKKGLPASRNVGIQHVKGDITCFIDDDVILPPTWVGEITKLYSKYQNISGAGGCVIDINPFDTGRIYNALSKIRSILFSNRAGKLSFIGIPYHLLDILNQDKKLVDTLTGCNMTFRTEVFKEQEFDESYIGSAWGEELDFCTSLKNKGKELLYYPKAFVIHNRTLTGGCRTNDSLYWLIRNNTYFLSKNFNSKRLRLFSLLLIFTPYMMLIYGFKGPSMTFKAFKDGNKQYDDLRGSK